MTEKDSQTDIEQLSGQIQNTVRQVLRRMRLEMPYNDLSMSQVTALARLDQSGGLTNAELARAEGVKPQSMISTIADLEAEGLVQRHPDPTDGRRIVLSLTEAGRQFRQTNQAAKQHWLTSIIAQLSPQERQELQRGLEILGRITK